jgi:quercetin dioxygenase-like cupin family protein
MNGSIHLWRIGGRFTLVAGAVLGVVLAGVIALRGAWATPPQGVTGSTIAGPVVLDEIDVKGESDTHEVEIKTRGLSDAYVVHRRIAPGGHTGWHSHPGPVFVLVTAGTTTKYHADPTLAPAVYPAGTGFVEAPGDVHINTNEGDTDVELIAFFLVPLGATPRIDERAPQ